MYPQQYMFLKIKRIMMLTFWVRRLQIQKYPRETML